jgi:hypothetical protein
VVSESIEKRLTFRAGEVGSDDVHVNGEVQQESFAIGFDEIDVDGEILQGSIAIGFDKIDTVAVGKLDVLLQIRRVSSSAKLCFRGGWASLLRSILAAL